MGAVPVRRTGRLRHHTLLEPLTGSAVAQRRPRDAGARPSQFHVPGHPVPHQAKVESSRHDVRPRSPWHDRQAAAGIGRSWVVVERSGGIETCRQRLRQRRLRKESAGLGVRVQTARQANHVGTDLGWQQEIPGTQSGAGHQELG